MRAARAMFGGDEAAPNEATTDEWCTPKWLADALGPFDLDPCSNLRSHIKAREVAGLFLGCDGLRARWEDDCSVFCNPPYSNVGPWAEKLIMHCGPWGALLKLDPTTKWWATLMRANPTVAPFRKRIKFESGTGKDMTANFPSVLVYSAWRPPTALVQHLWLPSFKEIP